MCRVVSVPPPGYGMLVWDPVHALLAQQAASACLQQVLGEDMGPTCSLLACTVRVKAPSTTVYIHLVRAWRTAYAVRGRVPAARIRVCACDAHMHRAAMHATHIYVLRSIYCCALG